jgi:hypothetical protein
VFVPGLLDEPTVTALVDGIGQRKVSVINLPGSLPQVRLGSWAWRGCRSGRGRSARR